jgi:hypothetical protein
MKTLILDNPVNRFRSRPAYRLRANRVPAPSRISRIYSNLEQSRLARQASKLGASRKVRARSAADYLAERERKRLLGKALARKKAIERKARALKASTFKRRRKKKTATIKPKTKINLMAKRKKTTNRRRKGKKAAAPIIMRKGRTYKSRGPLSIRANGPLNLRSVFNRENLTIAAGSVAAVVASNAVLSRFGTSLPGASHPYGRLAYRVAIPVLAAAATRRFSPNLSKGMVIGALADVVGTLTKNITDKISGVGEYLDPSAPSALQVASLAAAPHTVGAALVPTLAGPGSSAAMPDTLAGAFPASAW